MIFTWISKNKCHWPVRVMCRVLQVSSSGYYQVVSQDHGPSNRSIGSGIVGVQGYPCLSQRALRQPADSSGIEKHGFKTSLNRVAKIMRKNHIRAKFSRKFRCTTDSNHPVPVAANILNRQFDPKTVNKVWLADITYIPTREGWLYLAVVADFYSRRIVGGSMADRMTSRLVVDALDMAIQRRMPGEGILTHSDRGSQYASDHYQRLLEKHGVQCSMSGVGQSWDNAPMESFFASLKKELVHHEDYQTREEAKTSLFEYDEVFYNKKRIHSSLGYSKLSDYK